MIDPSPLRQTREAQLVRIDGESVEVAYDPDGELWFVRASSVPGLAASADTLDDLVDELPELIRHAMLP